MPVFRAQGHGRILMNSSILGFIALSRRGPYNATKYAMEGWADTLRLELEGTGIHVVLIEPGPITSKIRENAIGPFERWIDVEGSARAAQYKVLTKRLYEDRGPDKFELPASAVSKALIHALEAPRPKPRYFVTTPTYLMNALRRFLPTRLLDKILAKS